MEDVPFILRSPFPPDQRAEAIKQNVASIERYLKFIQDNGYDEFIKQCATAHENDGGENDDDADLNNNLGSSFEGGSLRDYQIYMLEQARSQNLIVHLGTGMGKTLISIFLIKEFLSRRDSNTTTAAVGDRSHILFLVPSIALAVQHTGEFFFLFALVHFVYAVL